MWQKPSNFQAGYDNFHFYIKLLLVQQIFSLVFFWWVDEISQVQTLNTFKGRDKIMTQKQTNGGECTLEMGMGKPDVRKCHLFICCYCWLMLKKYNKKLACIASMRFVSTLQKKTNKQTLVILVNEHVVAFF